MPYHPVSNDLKARIPFLRNQGFSIKEICGLLDLKKSIIYQSLAYHRYWLVDPPQVRSFVFWISLHRSVVFSVDQIRALA
jgi:hypothetical protein